MASNRHQLYDDGSLVARDIEPANHIAVRKNVIGARRHRRNPIHGVHPPAFAAVLFLGQTADGAYVQAVLAAARVHRQPASAKRVISRGALVESERTAARNRSAHGGAADRNRNSDAVGRRLAWLLDRLGRRCRRGVLPRRRRGAATGCRRPLVTRSRVGCRGSGSVVGGNGFTVSGCRGVSLGGCERTRFGRAATIVCGCRSDSGGGSSRQACTARRAAEHQENADGDKQDGSQHKRRDPHARARGDRLLGTFVKDGGASHRQSGRASRIARRFGLTMAELVFDVVVGHFATLPSEIATPGADHPGSSTSKTKAADTK